MGAPIHFQIGAELAHRMGLCANLRPFRPYKMAQSNWRIPELARFMAQLAHVLAQVTPDA